MLSNAASSSAPSHSSDGAPLPDALELANRVQQQQQQQQQQVNSAAEAGDGASRSRVAPRAADAIGRGAGQHANRAPSSGGGASRQINEQAASSSHRIKVTLSLPRNSDNNTGEPAAPDSSDHSNGASFDPKRRQSTATLISAAESASSLLRRPTSEHSPLHSQVSQQQQQPRLAASSSSSGPSSPLAKSVPPAQPFQLGSHSAAATAAAAGRSSSAALLAGAPVDRALQERELRRIASQRLTTATRLPAKASAATAVSEQHASRASQPESVEPPASACLATPTAAAAGPPPPNSCCDKGSPPIRQAKAATSEAPVDALPSPRQLAIYINGKIRSNSIFCQSSSLSDSFHNIFNRFHTSISNNQQQQQQSHQEKQQEAPKNQPRAAQNDDDVGGKDDEGRRTGRKEAGNFKRNAAADARVAGSSEQRDETLAACRREARKRSRARRLIARYLPLAAKREWREDLSRQRTAAASCEKSFEEEEEDEEDEEGSKSAKDSRQETQAAAPATTTTSYKLNPSSMFLRKAMRYYRLWIYCTNLTILLGTFLFIIAVLYVASDYRIPLVVNRSGERMLSLSSFQDIDSSSSSSSNNDDDENKTGDDEGGGGAAGAVVRNFPITFSEPSMLFAYIAVAIQAGILQIIGCFGAVRMREKFIQLFWYMILVLTVLDIVFLVYWLLRYDLMIKSLNEHMKYRLNEHFGPSASRFADELQLVDESSFKSGHLVAADQAPAASGGGSGDRSSNGNIGSAKFDKIFTNIINKIQSDSRCCGIASPLDYRRTSWRRVKLRQLENKLNWPPPTRLVEGEDIYSSLLGRVPLVPGSCCRWPRGEEVRQKQQRRPVILDDSELPAKVRVPAWPPSSVASEARPASRRPSRPKQVASDSNDGAARDKEESKSLADIIDERWTLALPAASDGAPSTPSDGFGGGFGNKGDENEDVALNGGDHDAAADQEQDWRLSKQQRRLLAKQDNYNLAPTSRSRRWAVESSVDGQARVLSRLIEEPDGGSASSLAAAAASASDDDDDDEADLDDEDLEQRRSSSDDDQEGDVGPADESAASSTGGGNDDDEKDDEDDEDGNSIQRLDCGDSLEEDEATPLGKLASLRRALFQCDRSSAHSNSTSSSDKLDNVASHEQWRAARFRWPNKLQLNYAQYKTLEGFLLAEAARLSSNSAQLERLDGGAGSGRDNRSRRSIFSSLIGGGGGAATEPPQRIAGDAPEVKTITKTGADLDDEGRRRALDQLKAALEEDPELGCAPRSHFDNSTIFTRGCHEPIRAWLDRSGHILFVTGFCVLSMLKLFSLLLLRLELREMIHKIRVLKGMATEYNALHDLEAYLPRPSVCAQAAELTASGVAAATATGAGAMAGAPGGLIGASGSASSPQQLSAAAASGGLAGGPCRASSMKAMTAMLAPSGGMCPRSSSVSAAQLQAALLQQRGAGGCFAAGCLRSAAAADAFLCGQQAGCGSGLMSRRHTAVSVCPTAAAVAQAAAQHLMSRRGTYAPPSLATSPLNLSQHRHSAHTVHTLPYGGAINQNSSMMLLNPASAKQHHHQHRSSLAAPASASRHYLGDFARDASAADESIGGGGDGGGHSSLDSSQSAAAATVARCFLSAGATPTSGGGRREGGVAENNKQHLYPSYIKRQSSGGAHSASNFALEPRPAASLLAESRRSIH